MSDEADKKAAEICNLPCDQVQDAVAAALREKDAEIAKLKSELETALEIVCKWAGTDSSDQPLENLILAVAAVLREAAERQRHLAGCVLTDLEEYGCLTQNTITELRAILAEVKP